MTAAAIVVTATLAFALVPGCNTMEGAGKDVEAAGESIQDAAD
ncbi:MAG: entericidin A/B family lipoprotein [Phycisphaerales bacterium]|nr:MAG: entericidin A/B family lipoprotein [Phycisphaerales bacterium]